MQLREKTVLFEPPHRSPRATQGSALTLAVAALSPPSRLAVTGTTRAAVKVVVGLICPTLLPPLASRGPIGSGTIASMVALTMLAAAPPVAGCQRQP
jgi:hypothetical protein